MKLAFFIISAFIGGLISVSSYAEETKKEVTTTDVKKVDTAKGKTEHETKTTVKEEKKSDDVSDEDESSLENQEDVEEDAPPSDGEDD